MYAFFLQPVLEEVIAKVREGVCSAVVVNAIINSFQPSFISHRALMFADLIKDCEETGLPKVREDVSFEIALYWWVELLDKPHSHIA